MSAKTTKKRKAKDEIKTNPISVEEHEEMVETFMKTMLSCEADGVSPEDRENLKQYLIKQGAAFAQRWLATCTDEWNDEWLKGKENKEEFKISKWEEVKRTTRRSRTWSVRHAHMWGHKLSGRHGSEGPFEGLCRTAVLQGYDNWLQEKAEKRKADWALAMVEVQELWPQVKSGLEKLLGAAERSEFLKKFMAACDTVGKGPGTGRAPL